MARRAAPIIAAAAASAAIVVTMLVIHGAHKRKPRQTHEKGSVASSRSGAGAAPEEREQRAIRDEEAADISTTRDDADAMAIGPSMGGGDVEQLGDDDVEEEASALEGNKKRLEEDPVEPPTLHGAEIVHQDALADFEPKSEENPIDLRESFDVPTTKSTDENTDGPFNTTSPSQESFEPPVHLESGSSSIEPIVEFVPGAEHEVKNTTIVMDIETSDADESEEETQFPDIILTSSIHEETKTSESCETSKSSGGEGVFSKEVDMNTTSNLIKSYDATSAIVFENTASNEAYADTVSSNNRDVYGESKVEDATTRANNASNVSITLAEINVITVNVNDSTPSKEECIIDDITNTVYHVPTPHDFTERKVASPTIMNSSSPADKLKKTHDDGVKGEETREGQQCPKRSPQKEHRQHSSSTLASVTSSEEHHHHHHHHFHSSLSNLVPHPSHLKEHLRHSLRVFKHDVDDGSNSHDGSISSSTAKNKKHISIKKKKNSKRELHLGSFLVKSASLYSVTPDLCPKPSQHAIHF
mmetsp:Transcript_28029/g.59309  ORF Transcript_28029/g.59309 Transcript_28029/m.59309 type:complete len:530 (+) Transcript_28029:156-1745(+)